MKQLIELEDHILNKANSEALRLRETLASAGTLVVNVMSSPGSGKTEMISALSNELRSCGDTVAVLVGDCATDHDAKRLAPHVDWVEQIVTKGICHLEPRMLVPYLPELLELTPKYLFIENVGNLVCPVDFDLGESVRISLLSTTEGEDKPAKYPDLFRSCDITVISKVDLAEVVEFSERKAQNFLDQVAPKTRTIKVSARTKEGVPELAQAIREVAQRSRGDEISITES